MNPLPTSAKYQHVSLLNSINPSAVHGQICADWRVLLGSVTPDGWEETRVYGIRIKCHEDNEHLWQLIHSDESSDTHKEILCLENRNSYTVNDVGSCLTGTIAQREYISVAPGVTCFLTECRPQPWTFGCMTESKYCFLRLCRDLLSTWKIFSHMHCSFTFFNERKEDFLYSPQFHTLGKTMSSQYCGETQLRKHVLMHATGDTVSCSCMLSQASVCPWSIRWSVVGSSSPPSSPALISVLWQNGWIIE